MVPSDVNCLTIEGTLKRWAHEFDRKFARYLESADELRSLATYVIQRR